jgi:hypothetical protein
MVAAGGLHGAAFPMHRRLAMIPVWLILGATGLGAAFYGVHELQARLSGGRNIEAPVMVYSARVFVALCGALLAGAVLVKTTAKTRAQRIDRAV